MNRLQILEQLEIEYHLEMKAETNAKNKELLKFQRDEIIKVIKIEKQLAKKRERYS